jgi:hypothetical protein
MNKLGVLAVVGLLPSCIGAPNEADLALEALTYTHVMQAEAATGAGSTVSDPAASGGAFHRNSVVGSTATATYTAPDTLQGAMVVRARRTGTGTAQLNILLDGVDHGAVIVSGTSWADFTVPTTASGSNGPHSVALYFRACSGSPCTLEVDTVTFGLFVPTPTYTALLQAESATGGGALLSDATASGGFYRSFTANGQTASLAFPTTGPIVSLVVRRRAGGAASCTPRGRVRIDGTTVFDGFIRDEGWNEHAFAVNRPLGAHTLEITGVAATAACPMQFDVGTVGTSDPPPPPVLQVIEAESAVGAGTVTSDAGASSGQARRFTAAYVGASVAGVVVAAPASSASVRVRATAACGLAAAPVGAIRVNGTNAWQGTVTSSSWTNVPLTAALFTAGTHTVEFYPRQASATCALEFDAVTLTP